MTVRRARRFNGNLRRWNTSSVTTMSKMFLNSVSFDGVGLSTWDTHNVVDMSYMFRFTPTFNGDISKWNVSRVLNMRSMFRQAVSFNGELSRWDLRNVNDISQMVHLCISLLAHKNEICYLTVLCLSDFSFVKFMHAVSFNADISDWTTSSVTNASEAFFGAFSFSGDVSKWDVRNLTDLTKLVCSSDLKNADFCDS
jgi:hypothetical protein